VLATNVAETSITIDGVRLVIDSGLARIARFDPHRGINTLLVEKISAASADQRAGRAGRTAPGVCVRPEVPRGILATVIPGTGQHYAEGSVRMRPQPRDMDMTGLSRSRRPRRRSTGQPRGRHGARRHPA